jgi:small conductance mechanosensitive channel
MNTLNNAAQEISTLETIANSQVVTTILKILWGAGVIILFLIIAKIIAGIVKRNIMKHSTLENEKNNEKIGKLIGNIVFYVLMIFAFFIGFEIMGFNVGLILWWVSFWVWLAFKEILGNMIAGIMILYTKEFKMGDIVEIFADQTYFGRIEEISIRYTIIRTLDLRQVVIPNMTLIAVPIKTFSAEEVVKLNFIVGVHYDTDVAKALQVVTDTVNSFDFVKNKDATKAFVIAFGDSSIDIQCFFTFDPKCGLIGEIAIGEINEKINTAFNENKIKVPYNMVTLTFEKDEDKKAIQKQI